MSTPKFIKDTMEKSFQYFDHCVIKYSLLCTACGALQSRYWVSSLIRTKPECFNKTKQKVSCHNPNHPLNHLKHTIYSNSREIWWQNCLMSWPALFLFQTLALEENRYFKADAKDNFKLSMDWFSSFCHHLDVSGVCIENAWARKRHKSAIGITVSFTHTSIWSAQSKKSRLPLELDLHLWSSQIAFWSLYLMATTEFLCIGFG